MSVPPELGYSQPGLACLNPALPEPQQSRGANVNPLRFLSVLRWLEFYPDIPDWVKVPAVAKATAVAELVTAMAGKAAGGGGVA